MLKKVVDLTSQDFSKGLNTTQDFFRLEKEETPNVMNVRFDFDGKITKRSGTNTMNAVALSTSAGTTGVTTAGWASYDFGAGTGVADNRWLVVAAGTAIYASSNLGASFVAIDTDRTSTYQYFERSKNILVCCSNNYDPVVYWAGSSGTSTALLNPSAPNAKYAINYRGFLVLLNTDSGKREFHYEDQLLQLTGPWEDSFEIPSSFDDEITGAFTLYTKLFVSTKYKLFAVSFVGGNPDWTFQEIKNWGFVPRTVDKIYVGDIGEIAVGLDYARRIRIFDGLEDRIVSDKVENDNGMCEFATRKISYAGSGLPVSFGKTDDNEQVYKLAVAIGSESSQVTHFLCYNGRTKAMYPYDYTDMNYMTMTMAESGNRRYLVAIDQSGWVHMMDSGNKDRNSAAIDEFWESPFLFDKSPSQLVKSAKIDLYFSSNSAGKLYCEDRVDFMEDFKLRQTFNINSANRLQHYESIDVPSTQNVYQYRVSSSASTNDPWELNRVDYFLKGLGIGRSESHP